MQPFPLVEDLPATLQALAQVHPLSAAHLTSLARTLGDLGCTLAICDISPLGIAAAQAAGIPSVLVENFTWDWIYAGYLTENPAFAAVIPEFTRLFASATVHIQTEPVCAYSDRAANNQPGGAPTPADPRPGFAVNSGCPGAPVVLISMGGFELEYSFQTGSSAKKTPLSSLAARLKLKNAPIWCCCPTILPITTPISFTQPAP